MATAIFSYFQKRSQHDLSSPSTEEVTFEDAAPIIKKCWNELMKDKVNVGERIFDYILTKEISMSKLFMQTNIEQQSGIFMVMMDKVVGFLDDKESMNDNLIKLGQLHVEKYGVKTKHFKHFRAAFLKAIKKYLPWTDRREESWQWFWSRIITQMTLATQANHYPSITNFNERVLTTEEMIEFAHYIHSTFDIALTNDPKEFAETFYKALLEQQPDIAKVFDSKSTSFETQSTRFIAMLNHAIKLLDDTHSFTTKLQKLSRKHVEYGVKIPMLQSFGDSLIQQVKLLNIKTYNEEQKDDNLQILASAKWTEKHDNAWNWFWKVVIDVFTEGMNQEQQEMKNKKQQDSNTYDKDQLINQDLSAI